MIAWRRIGRALLACMLASCVTQGTNLVADGKVEMLAASRLHPGVVRIIEKEGGAALVVDAQEFTDGARLDAYLSGFPHARYADGVLVTFVEKAANAPALYQAVIAFCVRNNVDLFARAATNKATADQVAWEVRASRSPYGVVP